MTPIELKDLRCPNVLPLTPAISDMESSCYIVPEAVREAIEGKGRWEDIWNRDEVKTFRNAVATGVCNQVWPLFLERANRDSIYCQTNTFDTDGEIGLDVQEIDASNLTPCEISNIFRYSNEAILTHLVSRQCNALKDDPNEYWQVFRNMCELARKERVFARSIPQIIPAEVAYIIRGIVALRIAGDIPNLVSDKAVDQNVRLSADQHRQSVQKAMTAGFLGPLYLLHLDVFEYLRDLIVTPDLHGLNRQAFESAFDNNELTLTLKQDLLVQAHEKMSPSMKATRCPFFSSRHGAYSLPHEYYTKFMAQLDRWYYPAMRRD